VQQPGPDRVAGRVDPGQGLPPQLGRAGHLVGQEGGAGGPFDQADPVEPGQVGRPRHLGPQLQGALEVPLGLGEGVGPLGLDAGLDRGRQGALQVPRGLQVVGELGGHGGAGAAGPSGMGGDRGRDLTVEPGPLARQQIGVGDLLEQSVAELVAVLTRPGHQQLAGHRLPQRLVETPIVQAGDGGQQPVRGPPADHRGYPQDLPGRLGDPLDPPAEQLVEGGGQLAEPGVGGRQQLLGEERVAFGPGEDAVDQAGRRRGAQDGRHLLGRLGPAQPVQLQALGPRPGRLRPGRGQATGAPARRCGG
jgi:hypothetical protein